MKSINTGYAINVQHRRPLPRQRGVVLFIALIMLVVMTVAAIAIVRSIDTGNVIAGNLAFKQAALQATDVGVEVGMAALPNIIATTLEADAPSVSSTTYYATTRVSDTQGAPTQLELGGSGTATSIDWASVPVASSANGYEIRVVIDRQCQGPAPVTDIQGKCMADKEAGGGSKRAGAAVFSGSTLVYYRITARANGPKNSLTIAQAVVGR